jgi:hypothetical protein
VSAERLVAAQPLVLPVKAAHTVIAARSTATAVQPATTVVRVASLAMEPVILRPLRPQHLKFPRMGSVVVTVVLFVLAPNMVTAAGTFSIFKIINHLADK